MVVIAFTELGDTDSWRNPGSFVNEKIVNRLQGTTLAERTDRLVRGINLTLDGKPRESLGTGELAVSVGNLVDAILSGHSKTADKASNIQQENAFPKGFAYESTFKAVQMFGILNTALDGKAGLPTVYKVNQLTGNHLIAGAMRLASAKIDRETLDEREIHDAENLQRAAREFIKKYTKRDYRSVSQLPEYRRELFQNLLFANNDLATLQAVKEIVQDIGIKNFSRQGMPILKRDLMVAFGGQEIAEPVVTAMFNKVERFLGNVNTYASIQELPVNEQAKTHLLAEFKEFQGLVAHEYTSLVDRSIVQKLNVDLGLGVQDHYEDIIHGLAELSLQHYDEDLEHSEKILHGIANAYLKIDERLSDLSSRYSSLLKLNNDLLSSSSSLAPGSEQYIRINPRFLSDEMKQNLKEIYPKINPGKSLSDADLAGNGEIILSMNRDNAKEFTALRRSVSVWLSLHRTDENQAEKFKQAITDSVREASWVFAPSINNSLSSAIQKQYSTSEGLGEKAISWLEEALKQKAKSLLEDIDLHRGSLEDVTKQELAVRSAASNYHLDIFNDSVWDEFLHGDFVKFYSHPDGTPLNNDVTRLLQISKEKLKELEAAAVDPALRKQLDLSYRKLIYAAFIKDLDMEIHSERASSNISDDYSNDKLALSKKGIDEIFVEAKSLTRLASNLSLVKKMKDNAGEPTSDLNRLKDELNGRGIESFYSVLDSVKTDEADPYSAAAATNISEALEKMLSNFAQFFLGNLFLGQDFIDDSNSSLDTLHGVFSKTFSAYQQKLGLKMLQAINPQ